MKRQSPGWPILSDEKVVAWMTWWPILSDEKVATWLSFSSTIRQSPELPFHPWWHGSHLDQLSLNEYVAVTWIVFPSMMMMEQSSGWPFLRNAKVVTMMTFSQWWWSTHQAPVPLTIFRPNSKFDQNLQCSSLKCILPTTTKFCTRHDSVTVVTCAKFRCDRLSIFE